MTDKLTYALMALPLRSQSLLLALMLAVLAVLPAMGQQQEGEAPVDTVQSTSPTAQDAAQQEVPTDTLDRLAPDFVLVSICIADPTDWHDDFLGVNGHAFIRLRCPHFDMDYCFSYESESADEDRWRFVRGKLCMGMYRVPTADYIVPYERWHCAIHEYELNLPPEAELRLWEIMDKKVDEGQDLEFDLMRRGCVQTLVQFVEQALGTTSIEYAQWPQEYSLTRREIMNKYLQDYPWLVFLLSDLMVNYSMDDDVSPERKIIYPAQLVEAWNHATVDGHPLMGRRTTLVDEAPLRVEHTWFTPLLLSLLVLLLAVIVVCLPSKYLSDFPPCFPFFFLQGALGVILLFLAIMSNLPGTRGAHLLPLYLPLPLILFPWRRQVAIPYALMLAAWAAVMQWWLHIYVALPHYIMALAVVLLMLKPLIHHHAASLRSKWQSRYGKPAPTHPHQSVPSTPTTEGTDAHPHRPTRNHVKHKPLVPIHHDGKK